MKLTYGNNSHFCSVLLAENDVIKISDFGTSRTWNEISVEMSFIGTYAWMAPEVIRKELCSEKMDVWYATGSFSLSCNVDRL